LREANGHLYEDPDPEGGARHTEPGAWVELAALAKSGEVVGIDLDGGTRLPHVVVLDAGDVVGDRVLVSTGDALAKLFFLNAGDVVAIHHGGHPGRVTD